MSTKKPLDRIFQEKLKDFEATPNPEVWNTIEAKLQAKKSKRKPFALWFKYTGVAALLALFFSVGYSVLYKNKTQPIVKNKTVITEEKPINKTKNIETKTENYNSELTYQQTEKTRKTKYNKEANTQPNASKKANNFVQVTNPKANILATKNTTKNETQLVLKLVSENLKNQNPTTTTGIPYKKETRPNTVNKANINLHEMANLNKELKDTLKIAETSLENPVDKEKNYPTIEAEIANAKEPNIDETANAKKWQVYANVAPVYYNIIGNGSHIDERFVNNEKSGNVNMSYGVQVSYAIANDLKLRSGINSLDLSYNTNNVIIYQPANGTNSKVLHNIRFTTNEEFSAISSEGLIGRDSELLANEIAALNQTIHYYEVPLELEYQVVDSKFGLQIIGGISTFFLSENKIYSEYNARTTEIGEANNINDVSFSGNLGLGIHYKFSKKMLANLQPTFKYQFNAYTNTAGNFNPYIIGVYTGISYKF